MHPKCLYFASLTRCKPNIVGGVPSNFTKHQFIAAIVSHEDADYRCSGTIINSNTILTAAHCIRDLKLTIIIGQYNLTGKREIGSSVHKVVKEVIHTGYEFSVNVIVHDIALLKFEPSLNDRRRYVKLNIDKSIDLVSRVKNTGNGLILGWGRKEESDLTSSSILLETRVPIRTPRYCKEKLEAIGSRYFKKQHVCAGWDNGIRDACQDDSGGPLLLETNLQVGIISFGVSCAKPESPGVYTRVSSYSNWIKKNS